MIASSTDLTCCILRVTESNPRQHSRTLISFDLSLCSKDAIFFYTISTINFSTLTREIKKEEKIYRDRNYIFATGKTSYLLYILNTIFINMHLCDLRTRTYRHTHTMRRLLYIHKLNFCSSFCILYCVWQIKSNKRRMKISPSTDYHSIGKYFTYWSK